MTAVDLPDRQPPRAMIVREVGLGVGCAVALAGQAVAIAGSWGGTYWLFGLVAGAVVCLIALARHVHRAGMALTALAVAAISIPAVWAAGLPREPGPAMALGLSVLIGSAVRTLSLAWAAAIAAGGLAVAAAATLAGPASSVAALNIAAWLLAVATGTGLRVLDTRRREVLAQVRRDERLGLARELHDVAAHHLTGIVLQAQAARLVGHEAQALDRSLSDIETAGSEALAALRRLVGLLRDGDDAGPTTPGPEQLAELVRRFQGSGPLVRLAAPDHLSSWPPEVASTVYRVVQECLTNVARHAPYAGSVAVDVRHDERTVTVEVVDDAPPVPARRHGGYGLIGMRERVEALGGTLCAGPRSQVGWSVVATLPLPAGDAR